MWKSYSGEEILYNASDENGKVSNESMLEDAVKQGLSTASDNSCQLLKFYWTDGFGWYFNGSKITFILHECKVEKVGKTLRGYSTCLRRALLQDIGYYFKIKNKEYTKFSKRLKDLADNFGYSDISEFIISHFGMFLITTPKFICHVTMSEEILNLIESLGKALKGINLSPSHYWENETLKQIMLNFDVQDLNFELMPDNVDLANTGEILNTILVGTHD